MFTDISDAPLLNLKHSCTSSSSENLRVENKKYYIYNLILMNDAIYAEFLRVRIYGSAKNSEQFNFPCKHQKQGCLQSISSKEECFRVFKESTRKYKYIKRTTVLL